MREAPFIRCFSSIPMQKSIFLTFIISFCFSINLLIGQRTFNKSFSFGYDASNVEGQTSWIVKMDPFGCLVPGCQELTNIESVDKVDIKMLLYPNPAHDFLNLAIGATNQNQDAKIVLSNLQGQTLKEVDLQLTPVNLMLDLHDLTSGIYIVQYIVDGLVLKSEKLVKE